MLWTCTPFPIPPPTLQNASHPMDIAHKTNKNDGVFSQALNVSRPVAGGANEPSRDVDAGQHRIATEHDAVK
jgi:hypothetical protein